MTQSRDFGPQAQAMREALERYSQDELIDLMTHILRVYVLDETTTLTPEVPQARLPSELTKLSFPQLILHLQMGTELEELGRFRISGDNVFVTIGDGGEFLLDGPTPVMPAPEPEERDEEEVDEAAEPEESAEPPDRARPVPEPLGQRAGPISPADRIEALFGGSASADKPNIPLETSPPKGPPPIAESAPGDMSPEELEKRTSELSDDDENKGEETRRAGFEEPPALAEGDKEIAPSNRFAGLELD